MKLEDHPLALDWLKQFLGMDVQVAAKILRTLYLVSHDKFEKEMRDGLSKLLTQSSSIRIGLFPVRDPSSPLTDQGSAGRVSHIIDSLSRSNNRFFNSPNDTTIKNQRIKHIVFVDDMVGSGTRMLAYKSLISKSIKARVSSDISKIAIFCFQILDHGKSVLQNDQFYKKAKFISLIDDMKLGDHWFGSARELCLQYGKRTGRYDSSYGYKGHPTNIVFAHKCPNNVPVYALEEK